jgi:threonine aldolase
MAQRVREGLAHIPGVRFWSPTEVNFVLVALPKAVWDGLVAEGYSFSRRGAPSDGVIRIACAFDTRSEDVDALLATAHQYAPTQMRADRPAPAVR